MDACLQSIKRLYGGCAFLRHQQPNTRLCKFIHLPVMVDLEGNYSIIHQFPENFSKNDPYNRHIHILRCLSNGVVVTSDSLETLHCRDQMDAEKFASALPVRKELLQYSDNFHLISWGTDITPSAVERFLGFSKVAELNYQYLKVEKSAKGHELNEFLKNHVAQENICMTQESRLLFNGLRDSHGHQLLEEEKKIQSPIRINFEIPETKIVKLQEELFFDQIILAVCEQSLPRKMIGGNVFYHRKLMENYHLANKSLLRNWTIMIFNRV